jgi:hypothetical protein
MDQADKLILFWRAPAADGMVQNDAHGRRRWIK